VRICPCSHAIQAAAAGSPRVHTRVHCRDTLCDAGVRGRWHGPRTQATASSHTRWIECCVLCWVHSTSQAEARRDTPDISRTTTRRTARLGRASAQPTVRHNCVAAAPDTDLPTPPTGVKRQWSPCGSPNRAIVPVSSTLHSAQPPGHTLLTNRLRKPHVVLQCILHSAPVCRMVGCFNTHRGRRVAYRTLPVERS
jgi:hypothetical protein